MISAVFLSMVLLPFAFAQPVKPLGAKSCVANVNDYGPECHSTTVVQRGPEETVKYTITIIGLVDSKMCCEAYTCLTNSCTMKSIGCGYHTLHSKKLHWKGTTPEKPKVRCRSEGADPFYYEFTTTH